MLAIYYTLLRQFTWSLFICQLVFDCTGAVSGGEKKEIRCLCYCVYQSCLWKRSHGQVRFIIMYTNSYRIIDSKFIAKLVVNVSADNVYFFVTMYVTL